MIRTRKVETDLWDEYLSQFPCMEEVTTGISYPLELARTRNEDELPRAPIIQQHMRLE